MKPTPQDGQPQSTASNGVSVVEKNAATAGPSEVLTPLTKKEQAALTDCEARIQRGWTTFVEVGTALAQIRDQRLYRQSHSSFDDYCANHWQYGRAYAGRLIGTAELARQLLPIGNTMQPTHEAQLRPLLGLPLDQAKEAWLKAAKEADGRPPTAKLVAPAPHAQRASWPLV